MNRRQEAIILVLLVGTVALGPFSLQISLPALPAVRAHFDVAPGIVQLVFSLSTLATAFATLVYGPLSDRFGRRAVMLAGIVIFLAGSAISLVATSISWLVFGRVVQSAGGAVGLVLSRAVVSDLYDRTRAASMIAYITMAMVLAPMAGVALGGILVDLASWRAIFVAGLIFGAVILAGTFMGLFETLDQPRASISPAAMLTSFRRLLRIRAFNGFALQGTFSLALFYSFLAGAPYIMIEVLNEPATAYGLWFLVISISFMSANFTAARLSARIGLERMVMIGSGGALLSVVGGLLLIALLPWHPVTVFVPMAITAFFQGLALPNAQAGAVAAAPDIAGAASGLSTFLQMAVAAVFAQLVGMLQNGTPYPTLFAMLFCAAAGFVLFMSLIGSRAPAKRAGVG